MPDMSFCTNCMNEFLPVELTTDPDTLMALCFGCAGILSPALTGAPTDPSPEVAKLRKELEELKGLKDAQILELGGGEVASAFGELKGRRLERAKIVGALEKMARETGALVPWSAEATFLANLANWIENRGHWKGPHRVDSGEPSEFAG